MQYTNTLSLCVCVRGSTWEVIIFPVSLMTERELCLTGNLTGVVTSTARGLYTTTSNYNKETHNTYIHVYRAFYNNYTYSTIFFQQKNTA